MSYSSNSLNPRRGLWDPQIYSQLVKNTGDNLACDCHLKWEQSYGVSIDLNYRIPGWCSLVTEEWLGTDEKTHISGL